MYEYNGVKATCMYTYSQADAYKNQLWAVTGFTWRNLVGPYMYVFENESERKEKGGGKFNYHLQKISVQFC